MNLNGQRDTQTEAELKTSQTRRMALPPKDEVAHFVAHCPVCLLVTGKLEEQG